MALENQTKNKKGNKDKVNERDQNQRDQPRGNNELADVATEPKQTKNEASTRKEP